MQFFPKWILKFHKQVSKCLSVKVSNTDQYLSWKLVSWGKFPRVLRIFIAIARNPTRGESWSRVTRFSILDFSIYFPNFFKLSPKMLYLGPIYPRKWGPIEIFHFLPPLLTYHITLSNPVSRKADITDTVDTTQTHRRRTIHFHKAQQQTIVLKTHYLLWALVKQIALLNRQYISRWESTIKPTTFRLRVRWISNWSIEDL
jgi:hypothetical protein